MEKNIKSLGKGYYEIRELWFQEQKHLVENTVSACNCDITLPELYLDLEIFNQNGQSIGRRKIYVNDAYPMMFGINTEERTMIALDEKIGEELNYSYAKRKEVEEEIKRRSNVIGELKSQNKSLRRTPPLEKKRCKLTVKHFDIRRSWYHQQVIKAGLIDQMPLRPDLYLNLEVFDSNENSLGFKKIYIDGVCWNNSWFGVNVEDCTFVALDEKIGKELRYPYATKEAFLEEMDRIQQNLKEKYKAKTRQRTIK